MKPNETLTDVGFRCLNPTYAMIFCQSIRIQLLHHELELKELAYEKDAEILDIRHEYDLKIQEMKHELMLEKIRKLSQSEVKQISASESNQRSSSDTTPFNPNQEETELLELDDSKE